MTTIKDLEAAVEAISRGNQQIALKSVALENPTIKSDIGPLTSKMAKEKTIFMAYALNLLLGSNAVTYAKMRMGIRNLADKLNVSDKSVTSSYAQSVHQLFERCNHTKISSALASVTKSLTPEPSTPIWATMLDITLATGLSMVPFVGPVLASAAQGGLGKLLSGAGSSGQSLLNAALGVSDQPGYNSTLKATTTLSGGIRQMPGTLTNSVGTALGTSKLTASQLLINYLASRDNKNAKASVGDPTFLTNFSRVINPMTQNQVLNNRIFDDICFKVRDDAIIKAKNDIEICLEGESDTINSYIDKFSEAVKLSGQLIVTVVNSKILDSFDDLLGRYDEFYNMMSAAPEFSGRPLFVRGTASDDDKAKNLALLIVAYYMRAGIEASLAGGTGVGRTFTNLFRSVGFNEPDSYFSGTARLPGAAQSSAMQILKNQKQDVADSFKETTDAQMAFDFALAKADTYITLVKDSMIDTITKVLFATNNSGSFKEILSVFSACSVIVNSVWKSTAIHNKNKLFNENMDIPDKAVALLKDAGFVTTYTTTIGRVSNEDKLKHMGGATIDRGTNSLVYSDTAKKTATLRYYKGTFKGASDREKVMVYLFARSVINDLNLFHVFMGVVPWQSVKEKLHEIIAEINIASHFVETKDMRPA